LLNVLAGFGLKIISEQAGVFWTIVLYVCGLATIDSVFWSVVRITASLWLACACALLLMFNPTFILYQNWLFYTMPALALLTVSCVLLFKMLDTRTVFWVGCFFTCLATLALTRNLFHLACILLVVGLLP
jgi:hypothetical protein